jgi:hypothetical protein
LLAGVLLTAWAAWFFVAPVPAYEVSNQAAHPVAAAASGRALASNLTLFENVQAGDGGLKEI